MKTHSFKWIRVTFALILLALGFINTIQAQSADQRRLSQDRIRLDQTTIITTADYVTFLNEVASDDPHHLYDAVMGEEGEEVSTIIRQGSPGSYTYECLSGEEERPVAFIDALSAMRYCNWLENQSIQERRPEVSPNPTSLITEMGTYDLRGEGIIVNPDATYTLSEDEEKSLLDLRSSMTAVEIVVHSNSARLSMISPSVAGAEVFSTEEIAAAAAAIGGVILTEGHRPEGERPSLSHSEQHGEALPRIPEEEALHQEAMSAPMENRNYEIRLLAEQRDRTGNTTQEEPLEPIKSISDEDNPHLKKLSSSLSSDSHESSQELRGLQQEHSRLLNLLNKAQQAEQTHRQSFNNAIQRRENCSLGQKTVRRFRSKTQKDIDRQIDAANLGIGSAKRDIITYTQQLRSLDQQISRLTSSRETPSSAYKQSASMMVTPTKGSHLLSSVEKSPGSTSSEESSINYKTDRSLNKMSHSSTLGDNNTMKRLLLPRAHDESDESVLHRLYEQYGSDLLPPESLSEQEKVVWNQNILAWVDTRNRMKDIRAEMKMLDDQLPTYWKKIAELEGRKQKLKKEWFQGNQIKDIQKQIDTESNSKSELEQKIRLQEKDLKNESNRLEHLSTLPGSKRMYNIMLQEVRTEAIERATNNLESVKAELATNQEEWRKALLLIGNDMTYAQDRKASQEYIEKGKQANINNSTKFHSWILHNAISIFEYSRLLEDPQGTPFHNYGLFDSISPFHCHYPTWLTTHFKDYSFYAQEPLLSMFSPEEKAHILQIAHVQDWTLTQNEIHWGIREGRKQAKAEKEQNRRELYAERERDAERWNREYGISEQKRRENIALVNGAREVGRQVEAICNRHAQWRATEHQNFISSCEGNRDLSRTIMRINHSTIRTNHRYK